MKEQDISQDQYLESVYSQSRTLYDLIPHAPHPIIDPTKPLAETLVDGVVGSIQSLAIVKPANKQSPSTSNSSSPTIFIQLNAIQYSQTPSNKKKGKGKIEKYGNNRRIQGP